MIYSLFINAFIFIPFSCRVFSLRFFLIMSLLYLVFLITLLYFRVMGLKLPPPLVLWGLYFFTSFFMLVLFNLISFGENYLGRIVYGLMKLVFLLVFNLPWIAIYSYSLLFIYSFLYILMKAFLTVSMIVGNFIDVYILGLIAVLISFILYLIIFGIIISSLWLFIFLSNLLYFLFILGLLELFSCFFQSLTLSNRLSINMLCGSLLTSLLCAFIYYSFISSFNIGFFWVSLNLGLLIIFLFECFNSIVQCAIFNVLGFEYLVP